MLEHRSIALVNGLRVITVEQPHLHTVTVCLAVRCGARHDPPGKEGLTHFLEHMLFRGSRHVGDCRRLMHAFEVAGGALHAATWRDHTSFVTTLHPSHLASVLTTMADMVSCPRLSDIDLERAVVREEIQADLDEQGRDVDLTNLSRAAVWPRHTMGRRVAGSLQALARFTLDDLQSHHARFYGANNCVLCIAGPVRGDDVQRLASTAFAAMSPGATALDGPRPTFAPAQALQVQDREGSQVAVQLTFPAFPDTHPQFTGQVLLTSILDDGMTSRLPHVLSERRGLVYELASGLDCYADCGLYDIEMQVAPARATEAVQATLDVLACLRTAGLSPGELQLARQRHLHELEFRVDSTEDLATHFAVEMLFGRHRTLRDEWGALHAVRETDVDRAVEAMFCQGQMHATIVGPTARLDIQTLDEMIQRFRAHMAAAPEASGRWPAPPAEAVAAPAK